MLKNFTSRARWSAAEGGTRHFDHDADLDVGIELGAFLAQFPAAFIENGVGASQFFNAGDHWIHDAHISNSRRAEDGSQLRLEDLRVLQAEANCSATKKRILLMLQFQAFRGFVSSDVQSSDDDRIGSGSLGDEAIVLVLLGFIGRLAAVQVEKLRPIKSDTFGAACPRRRRVPRAVQCSRKG